MKVTETKCRGVREEMELNFNKALLDKWINDLNARNSEIGKTFGYSEGGKYIKVTYGYSGKNDGSVFAFVDADGNIYKPAGWKTPAKGVRARIDRNPPMTEKDLYSARYKSAVYGESVSEEIFTEKASPDGYAPKKTGIAYKVFKVKNGKLYPPMVANAGGADTPVGIWLDAEEGEFAGLSKTGRPQVKSTGSGNLSYRPGWHLGDVPRAKQFDRLNKETGEYEFPKDFVWAECEYAMDIDYQPESDARGYERTKVDKDGNVIVTKSDKYQHSLAGLPRLPKDGYYKYRTNPNPDTVPWVITGQMKVNRLLSDAEVNAILKKNGIPPIHRQGGDKTLAELGLKESVANASRLPIAEDVGNNDKIYVIDITLPYDSDSANEGADSRKGRWDAFVLNALVALEVNGYEVFESHKSNIPGSFSYYIFAFKGEDFENSDIKVMLHIRLSDHKLRGSIEAAKKYFGRLSNKYKMPIEKDKQDYVFLNIIAKRNSVDEFHRALGELKSALANIESEYYGDTPFRIKEDWYFDNDSPFSKEQLMEFAGEFEEALQNRFGLTFSVAGIFFDDGFLEIDIQSHEVYDTFTVSEKVDMRRVKTVKDLNKFIPKLLDQAVKHIVDDEY